MTPPTLNTKDKTIIKINKKITSIGELYTDSEHVDTLRLPRLRRQVSL